MDSGSIWRPPGVSSARVGVAKSNIRGNENSVKRATSGATRTALAQISDNIPSKKISQSQNLPILKDSDSSLVPVVPHLNRVVSFGGTSTSSAAFPFPIFCDSQNENTKENNDISQVSQERNVARLPISKSTPNILSGDVCNLPFDNNREEKHREDSMEEGEVELEKPKRLPLGDLSAHVEIARDSPMMMDVVASGEKPMEMVQSTSRGPSMSELEHKETIDMLDMEEYKHEIYSYLNEAQEKHLPKSNYMTKQPDITFPMRAILVDWLVEVSEEYKLHNETLYLAVNYVDRFLSFMSVQRAKLQLVGTACMFIAAKYEEIYPPDIGEFVYITDDTYSKKQVLRMEQLVLKVLNFDLAVPTTLLFVTKFSKVLQSNDEALSLAQYLSELTLLEAEKFLPYKYSVVAAASVALARHTLSQPAWPEVVVQMSGLNVEDFKECLILIHQVLDNAPNLAQQAIREKYKATKYQNVSSLKPTPIF